MKRGRWQLALAAFLVSLSGILYLVHYLLFRDAHSIGFYIVLDLAFVPVNTLIVTLFIEQLLVQREKRLKMKKLNMVIGAFFSNVGVQLLKVLSRSDSEGERIRGELIVRQDWTVREFSEVSTRIKKYDFKPRPAKDGLKDLSEFLGGRRDFLLRLLENPNLLEHDAFADLLWAVFHLTEELSYREGFRENFERLPDSDYAHLLGDIKRAYGLLVFEWLEYMRHLKEDYPYLFSLALRTNPFDLDADPVVK